MHRPITDLFCSSLGFVFLIVGHIVVAVTAGALACPVPIKPPNWKGQAMTPALPALSSFFHLSFRQNRSHLKD